MTVSIVLQTVNTATVTRTPCWLAQWLFFSEASTVLVHRVRMLGFAPDGVSPRYAWLGEDNREVSPKVTDAIDRALTLRAVGERQARLVRK